MSANNCGCNSGDCNTSGEYLMVKATPSDAGLCGNPTSLDPAKNCEKQEKMFDFAQSGFIIPLPNGQTAMKVCNSKIYTANMWLEFFNPVCKLKITAISADHTLTLVNRCPGGAVVKSNPDAGTAVPTGTKFVVCSQPDCTSGAEFGERLVDTLATLGHIPIGNMSESSPTDAVQPIGHIRSNPTNIGVAKVIKRIYGIMFNAGRPVLTALGFVNDVTAHEDYTRLVIHKTTKIVSAVRNRSDNPSISARNKYVEIIQPGKEYLAQTFLTHIGRTSIEQNVRPSDDPDTWPTFTNSFIKKYNVNVEYPPLKNLPTGDEYYIMVTVDVAVMKRGISPTSICTVFLNGDRRGMVRAGWNTSYTDFNTITAIVRVQKANHELTLKLECTGTAKFFYGIHIEAMYY